MHLPTRRAIRLLIVICASLALATGVRAAAPPKKPKPKIPYMAIASVDTAAKTITIAPKNSTATNSKTYKFTDKTKVTVNGHDGTLSDLKPGLAIRVGTGMDETVADELTVTPPPPDPK